MHYRKGAEEKRKKCRTLARYQSMSFPLPRLNRLGECEGCYCPDTGRIEPTCHSCPVNERFEEGNQECS